ncbi:MAG: PadR family transcriptional regulator PadR [Phycisphaerales bacterium]|jgi:PadR family transcriptional regulator PadR
MPATTNADKPSLKPDHYELLVLSVLAEGQTYGYAITKAVTLRSEGAFTLAASQLYPLLKKLEKQGLVTASWEEVKAQGADPAASGRRRKWYALSPKGHKRLTQRIEAHRRFTAIIESFISVPGLLGDGEPA